MIPRQHKKLLIFTAVSALLFLAPLFTYAATSFVDAYPKPTTFINDYAGVLTKETQADLEKLVQGVAQNSGPQIAVAVVPTLDGTDIDTARNELFQAWGVGVKGKDNGVLVLIAIAERKIGIETGYGMEGDLPDLETARLRDTYAVPEFRAGDYNKGVSLLVNAIAQKLTGGELPPAPTPTSKLATGILHWPIKTIFYLIIIIFIFLRQFYYKMALSKNIWLGGIVGLLVGIGFAIWLRSLFSIILIITTTLFGFALDFLVSRVLPTPKPPSGGGRGTWFFGGGSGGSSGSGSGGGSFGGFGGGGSGGGGSSGSW